MDLVKMARICKILSVEARLRIIKLLMNKPMCVNALSRNLGLTPAAVSQHLRLLRDAGMVRPERKGYFVHYSLNSEAIDLVELERVLLHHDDG